MNHEALEQAAKDTLLEFMNTGTPDTDEYWSLFKVKNEVNDALVRAVEYGYKKAFIAGASWREQQAASNFGHFWESLSVFDGDRVKSIEAFCKEAWMGGKMASAKLLAEKDAEIEELKKQASWYLSLSPADKKSFGDLIVQLNEAKELIKEMRETYDRIGHPMEFLNVGKFLHENADKIKALLGEE